MTLTCRIIASAFDNKEYSHKIAFQNLLVRVCVMSAKFQLCCTYSNLLWVTDYGGISTWQTFTRGMLSLWFRQTSAQSLEQGFRGPSGFCARRCSTTQPGSRVSLWIYAISIYPFYRRSQPQRRICAIFFSLFFFSVRFKVYWLFVRFFTIYGSSVFYYISWYVHEGLNQCCTSRAVNYKPTKTFRQYSWNWLMAIVVITGSTTNGTRRSQAWVRCYKTLQDTMIGTLRAEGKSPPSLSRIIQNRMRQTINKTRAERGSRSNSII